MKGSLFLMVALIVATAAVCRPVEASTETEDVTFEIKTFSVEGNTVLAERDLNRLLETFTGDGKTAADVEAARDGLERFYHQNGYPTVLVNIPEQTVDHGLVSLQVIESRIRRVRVTGNKYHTMESIRRHLPSLSSGEILYLPKIRRELARANRVPDLQVAPVLAPGRELGSIDVELKVEDRLPLHGSIELNNRSSHDTTPMRLNGSIRYDHLWQLEHSLSLQFQASPQDWSEVKVFSGSYSLPAPWQDDHLLSFYYIYSDSATATGDGFSVIGRGKIAGARYVMGLPPVERYQHNITLGIDHKDFKEDQAGEEKPIAYTPATVGYASSMADEFGTTQFSASVNLLFREVFSDPSSQFEAKRNGSRGNYIYFTGGIERRQKLPLDAGLFVKLDGQIADQPLINNEQYAGGGVGNVRGFKAAEVLGDNAIHATIEVNSPEWRQLFDLKGNWSMTPYVFYDVANLHVIDALPEQTPNFFLAGTGFGVEGGIWGNTYYKLDWGYALESTGNTASGENRFYYQMRYVF